MTIDDQIRDENLQHNINGEEAKISPSLSGKTDNYEYLTGEEVTCFPLKEAFKKTTTKEQFAALKSFNLSNKIEELNQIKGIFPQNQMNSLILDRPKKSGNGKLISS